jgi:hypothetical protein
VHGGSKRYNSSPGIEREEESQDQAKNTHESKEERTKQGSLAIVDAVVESESERNQENSVAGEDRVQNQFVG